MNTAAAMAQAAPKKLVKRISRFLLRRFRIIGIVYCCAKQDNPRALTTDSRIYDGGTEGRYLREHKEEAIDLGNRLYREKKSRIAWTYDWTIKNNMQDPNGYASPKSINYMQKLNINLGRIKKVIPIDKVATMDFQKGLIAAIGEYKR